MGIRSGYVTVVLEAASFKGVKNYEGSIYEWGGKEELPMEK